MNSLATEQDESAERRFTVALRDPNAHVRMAAALCLGAREAESARQSLLSYWEEVKESPQERWAAILALERADVDTSSLLAEILSVSEEIVIAKLADYSSFAEMVNQDAQGLGPNDGRFLRIYWSDHLRRMWRRSNEGNVEPELDPIDGAAEQFLSELRFAISFIAPNSGLLEMLGPRLAEATTAGGGHAVVDLLAKLAVADGRWYVRSAAAKSLAGLGIAGSAPLIATLLGDPVATPDPEAIEALRREAGFSQTGEANLSAPAQHNLAPYLAVEALEKFYDDGTLRNLVALALSPEADASTRANIVLTRMPLDVSLPPLFWVALADPSGSQRAAASSLMAQITSKRGQTELAYHIIGSDMTEADFKWMNVLLGRCRDVPDWADSPAESGVLSWCKRRDSCIELLRQALVLTPAIEGTVDYSFYSQSSWDRFTAYLSHPAVRWFGRGGKGPPSTVQRHLGVDVPAKCILHRRHPLRVRLTADMEADTHSSPLELTFAGGEREIALLVVVHASDCEVTPPYHTLRVPRNAASDWAEFVIVPRSLGPVTIDVSLIHGVERVGYACVDVTVVGEGEPAGTAPPWPVEAITDDAISGQGGARAVIQVDWQKNGFLVYNVIDPAVAGTPSPAGTSPEAFPRENVAAWVSQQNEIIRDYLKEDYATDADLRGAMASLRGIGATLFDQLIPPELAEVVRRWPAGSIVYIESNEGWLPWELIAPSADHPFWGQHFQLVRMPRMPDGSVSILPAVRAAGLDKIRASTVRITAIVGDHIDRGPRPAFNPADTFGVSGQLVREVVNATFEDMNDAICDADVVHFTCHGRYSGTYYLSLGETTGRRLVIGQVPSLNLRPNALVFANACASDRSELLLSELQNFGWKFYSHGARPFIGTLGPIPARQAIRFAELFYHWFIGKGFPVGRAMQQAREAAMSEVRNPFWLFYAVYGSATAVWRPTTGV